MTEEKKKVGAGFGVMMLRGGKVLLGKRHDDAEKASSALRGEGTWTMPGGKFEWGETFETGAARELKEETGMILNKAKVICVNNDKNEHAHFITVGFLAIEVEGEPKVMEPDEITEWKWFEMDKLPINVFDPSKNLLVCYLNKKIALDK